MENQSWFILIAFLVLLPGLYFLFRKKHDDKAIVTKNLDYKNLLNSHVEYYQNLIEAEKTRFAIRIQEFLQHTTIEGVGTKVSDADKIMIAASAVIPVFGFPEWRYHNLTNVILYPDTFDGDFRFEGAERSILGMVGSGYMNGQMLLSRVALVKGFSKQSGIENTAIHEFVHLLDKADGATDGVPENLLKHEYCVPWLNMMHQEMHRIKANNSDIDPYALTNEAEFLAVASEYFFEKPVQFKTKHPEIYTLLSEIFAQHPADATKQVE